FPSNNTAADGEIAEPLLGAGGGNDHGIAGAAQSQSNLHRRRCLITKIRADCLWLKPIRLDADVIHGGGKPVDAESFGAAYDRLPVSALPFAQSDSGACDGKTLWVDDPSFNCAARGSLSLR